MLVRIIVTVAALVVILYGVIAALTPLPVGVLAIVLGLTAIALANPRARPLLKALRKRWRWFDSLVRAVAERAPERYRDPLRETEPEPGAGSEKLANEKHRTED